MGLDDLVAALKGRREGSVRYTRYTKLGELKRSCKALEGGLRLRCLRRPAVAFKGFWFCGRCAKQRGSEVLKKEVFRCFLVERRPVAKVLYNLVSHGLGCFWL